MLMISGKIMKDSHKTYIKSFSLQGLWGYKEVEWTTINSDVNVLVGINGSGKLRSWISCMLIIPMMQKN